MFPAPFFSFNGCKSYKCSNGLRHHFDIFFDEFIHFVLFLQLFLSSQSLSLFPAAEALVMRVIATETHWISNGRPL